MQDLVIFHSRAEWWVQGCSWYYHAVYKVYYMLHICACMCHTANFTERLQRGKRHSYVSRKKRRLHGNVSGSLGKSPWTWGGTISLSESHHEPQMQSPKDGDCSFPCVSALAPLRWPRSHARGPIDKNGSPTLINLSPGRQSKRGSKRTKNRERQKQGPWAQETGCLRSWEHPARRSSGLCSPGAYQGNTEVQRGRA